MQSEGCRTAAGAKDEGKSRENWGPANRTLQQPVHGVEKGKAGEGLQSIVPRDRHRQVYVTYLTKLNYLLPGVTGE
ncbi:hypothetical protein KM043_015903 [Ampulex compressa]|nr:hypothetical protein KM043_015903 [Ampulex compressa]